MTQEKINKLYYLLCLCFLFLVILVDQPTSAKEEKSEILIGAHLPLSGAGKLILKAAKLKPALLNQKCKEI